MQWAQALALAPWRSRSQPAGMAVRLLSSTWAQGRVSVKLQREGQQQVPGAQMAAVPPLPAYKSWAFLPANERALHTGLRMFYIDATGAHAPPGW